MRRFLSRFVLGAIGTWLAATIVPGVTADHAVPTFLLMGLFIAAGDLVIHILDHGIGILLFFLPRSLRLLALRAGTVAIATGLVSGFSFTDPIAVGLLGTTLLLSILFLLPLAN